MEKPRDETLDELLVHGPVYAISKLVKRILESTDTYLGGAHNLMKMFFLRDEYRSDTSIDYFLKRCLLVVLNLPSSEEERKTKVLEIFEKCLFGEDTRLIQKVITRSLLTSVSPEDSNTVLTRFALKFHCQRKFPKFIELLIEAVDSNKHSIDGTLNTEFLDCLAEYAVKLPISQNLSLWTTICSIFGKDWKQKMTGAQEKYARLRLAAQLLSTLLLNIRLADYSIRDETLDDVMKLFDVIKDSLKMLTELALEENSKEIVTPLLTLAFAYGELHQLLLLYSPLYAERQPPKSQDSVSVQDEMWDFSFFHTYASSEQWFKLAEETQQSHVANWAPLVLQKIRYLILFSGQQRFKQEKLVKKLVAYLMEHFDKCQSLWLNNLKYILPFMAPRQLGALGKKMIESPDCWAGVLSDQDVTEKRTLQMSLICSVFGSIHDHCRKRKAENDELALSSGTLSVLKMFSVHVDLWIGSVDRGNKEVTGWLRQCAEHLRESMRVMSAAAGSQSTKAEHDLTELLRPLDMLENLPLEYVLGPVHSGTLMGLLSLLVSCSQEPIKSRIWMMIVRLLDTEKNSPLFEYFPCTEFMVWVVTNTKDLPDCALIFSTLFDEVLRSPKSSKEGFEWLRQAELPASALPVIVLAIKKLVQHKQSGEKIFSFLRKRFLTTFEEGLDKRLVDVMEGTLCLLELYLERPSKTATTVSGSSNEKEAPKPLKIKSLLKNLPQLVEAARDGLLSSDEVIGSSSAVFLSFLLAHQQALAKFFTRDPKMSTWNAYRLSPNPLRWEDRLLRQLIAKANKKELLTMTNAMMDDLQSVTAKALEEETSAESVQVEVRRVSCFFRHLVTVDFPTHEDRYGIRLQVIQTALPLIQHLVLSICRNHGSDTDCVVRLAIPPMGIYLALLNTTYAYPHDITSPLHACLALPLNADMSAEHFESIFTVLYKTLHYLLTKHQEVAADRVPVVLQVYRRLLACTCSRSDSRRPADQSQLANLTDSANRLARLASVINTQPLRYRRAAAYIIVDLLNELKKQPLYPTVKQELTMALYHLMDLLDQHATRYLLAVLPPGTHELFRLEYEHFEKFYKFKGKV